MSLERLMEMKTPATDTLDGPLDRALTSLDSLIEIKKTSATG